MGRSVVHANRDDGKTLCGRFYLSQVIHLASFRQKAAPGEMLDERVTCKACLRLVSGLRSNRGSHANDQII